MLFLAAAVLMAGATCNSNESPAPTSPTPTVGATPSGAATSALTTLTVEPSTVTGGQSAQGTATLGEQAPEGGTLVTLSSDAPGATVPESITIPAGATSGTFTVTTSAVSAATDVTITGSAGDETLTASLQLTPATSALTTLTVRPSAVAGGQSAQGTATLRAQAPEGGTPVKLSSDAPGATVPASITIPAGATSGTFTVTTKAVLAATNVTITGSAGDATLTAPLQLTAVAVVTVSLATLSVNPTALKGDQKSRGTVTLTGPAPAGGMAIALASDDTVVKVPASITIAERATSGTFEINTQAVDSDLPVNITASAGGVKLTALIRVLANNAIESISVDPSRIDGGNTATATVTLSFEAPGGGTEVALESNNGDALVPSKMTVAAGKKSGTFTIETRDVSKDTEASITASVRGESRSVQIRLVPRQPRSSGASGKISIGATID